MFRWTNLIGEFTFFSEFKIIHGKLTCWDRIFDRELKFWHFYKSFLLTKHMRFQILSKNKKFEILFWETLTLSHVLTRHPLSRSMLATRGGQHFYV